MENHGVPNSDISIAPTPQLSSTPSSEHHPFVLLLEKKGTQSSVCNPNINSIGDAQSKKLMTLKKGRR